MKVDRQTFDGITVLSVAEPLDVDTGTADAFKGEILSMMGDAHQVILDLSMVEFFDSDGMGALLSLQKSVEEREGKLVLTGINRAVQEIFSMVGFDVIFESYPDVPEAVDALRV